MEIKQVKDYMTTNVITITSDKTIPEAYWLMIENKVNRLPVVDKGKLVGFVTLEDLRRAEPPMGLNLDLVKITDKLAKMTIYQVMTKELKTISPADTLSTAVQLMLDNQISALPVLEGNQLVGIITHQDILQAFLDLIK